MSLKSQICLYACLAKDEPLAVAVYNVPGKMIDSKSSGVYANGGTIFPIAVGVRLTERIRINKSSGIVKWTPRYDFVGETFPFSGGFALDDPKSDSWVRWEPDGDAIRQSFHFMLQHCAARDLCGFRLDLEQDWSIPGFLATIREVKPNPLKLTRLEWLTAWQLPFWEREHLSNEDRFNRIQAFANAYKIKGWSSFSHFQKRLAAIKGL
jgi:hypothetical protein